MVTSDKTPLSEIRMDAKTGSPTRRNPLMAEGAAESFPPVNGSDGAHGFAEEDFYFQPG
jgi:hypothetical protein